MLEQKQPSVENTQKPERYYLDERKERRNALYTMTQEKNHDLSKRESASGFQSLMPDNLIRDPVVASAVECRSMDEANDIYKNAKPFLGRPLTSAEEQSLLVVLDYICKRIVLTEMSKQVVNSPEKTKTQYSFEVYDYRTPVLPGDEIFFAHHDLVHIVLAIKQGILNENSVVPTFMQTNTKFNTDQQSILEEAFTMIYTADTRYQRNQNYDDFIKDPAILHGRLEQIFNESSKDSLIHWVYEEPEDPFRKALFKKGEKEFGEKAVMIMSNFVEYNKKSFEENDPFKTMVLLSQGLSLGELFDTEYSRTLPAGERLFFVQQKIKEVQENIDALLSGKIEDEKNEKYKKTVEIIRETFEHTVKVTRENPDKPIFVEMLLETLTPLYARAKAQQDASFERFKSAKYDTPHTSV